MNDHAAIEFGPARRDEVAAIAALLADDVLGKGRESPDAADLKVYHDAFGRIEASADNRVYVARLEGAVVGTFQLTFIPGLSLRGGTRAQIEAVRVAAACRGAGIGRQMIGFAIAAAREAGCCLVQLTMHSSRTDTRRFYAGLGFEHSHDGFKLML